MTLSTFVLAWSLAALAPTALAQVDSDNDPDRGDQVRLRRMLIRQYDADDSGDLSDEEWERLREEMQSPRAETQPRVRRAAARPRDDRRDVARGRNHRRAQADRGRSTEYPRYTAGRGSFEAAGGSGAFMAQVHMSRKEMLEFDDDGDGELDDAERSELRAGLRQRMEKARDNRFNAYVDRVLQGASPREMVEGRRHLRRHARRHGRFARRGAPHWRRGPHWQHDTHLYRHHRGGPQHFHARRAPAWEHRRFAHAHHPPMGPPRRVLLAQRFGRSEFSRPERRDDARPPERDRPSTRRRRDERSVERGRPESANQDARGQGRGARDSQARRGFGPGRQFPDLQRVEAMLKRFDKDGDGQLSEDERAAIREEFRDRRERFRDRPARPGEPDRPMRRRFSPPDDREREADPAEIEDEDANTLSVEPSEPLSDPVGPDARIVV